MYNQQAWSEEVIPAAVDPVGPPRVHIHNDAVGRVQVCDEAALSVSFHPAVAREAVVPTRGAGGTVVAEPRPLSLQAFADLADSVVEVPGQVFVPLVLKQWKYVPTADGGERHSMQLPGMVGRFEQRVHHSNTVGLCIRSELLEWDAVSEGIPREGRRPDDD